MNESVRLFANKVEDLNLGLHVSNSGHPNIHDHKGHLSGILQQALPAISAFGVAK